jgi:hypothetical protein
MARSGLSGWTVISPFALSYWSVSPVIASLNDGAWSFASPFPSIDPPASVALVAQCARLGAFERSVAMVEPTANRQPVQTRSNERSPQVGYVHPHLEPPWVRGRKRSVRGVAPPLGRARLGGGRPPLGVAERECRYARRHTARGQSGERDASAECLRWAAQRPNDARATRSSSQASRSAARPNGSWSASPIRKRGSRAAWNGAASARTRRSMSSCRLNATGESQKKPTATRRAGDGLAQSRSASSPRQRRRESPRSRRPRRHALRRRCSSAPRARVRARRPAWAPRDNWRRAPQVTPPPSTVMPRATEGAEASERTVRSSSGQRPLRAATNFCQNFARLSQPEPILGGPEMTGECRIAR